MSFSIKEKTIIAIIGESGSGKSTILNMIGMLEEIDDGQIILKGKSIPKVNSRFATNLRRNTINYLFQSYALITDKTVEENLLLALHFGYNSKREKINKIDSVLEELDILYLKNEKVNTLSGGEKQRVDLARCVLKPGEIILADESTGPLDGKMAYIVFELLKKLIDKYHKTIIIVTHDMELARYSDNVIHIDKIKY